MCINEDNLFPCEAGMDTCQTTVSFSDVSQKVSIIKTCTKNASCERQVNATRISTPCDRSYSSWICTTCCYDDACNVNVATTARVSMTTVVVALTLALMGVNFARHCDTT
ncbi:hypothetical protein NP493_13g14023 [Ridgeia piscesae]|uniref:Uncharacterized protein n=1 Tax=Ridgeia piscesae TaxID=27915 RepID=A0AAD9PER3_RIDPI|nr:hypothetical protein NP493_13g14023 [Ridgeia piscesae]